MRMLLIALAFVGGLVLWALFGDLLELLMREESKWSR
jgi:hypothetical protein